MIKEVYQMSDTNQIGSNLKQYEGVIIRNSLIGDDVVLGTDAYIQNANLGNHCKIERRDMVFDSEIGDYSYTGYNTVTKNCRMGRFCSVSWNVSIGGADHNYKRFSTFPFALRNLVGGGTDFISLPCKIGNDVWIGAGAIITNGVILGDGAVIGAGTIVTHDVPPYAIVVGNSAKVIKYRFPDDFIERLIQIKWWDWPDEVIRNNFTWLISDNLNEDILARMENVVW